MHPNSPISPPVWPDWEPSLEAFERAWREGTVPRIDDYLPAMPDGSVHEALVEIVKLDLEYRWRRAADADSAHDTVSVVKVPVAKDVGANGASGAGLPARPVLEDYASRYPGLGPAADWPPELIAEEYRVRRQWGDKPGRRSYLARFPRAAQDFETLFDRVDRELGAETSAPSAVANRLVPGFEIPGFEILEELGRGGMGVVYRARQLSLGRIVALKMVLSGEHAGPLELARFRAEAELVARLRHPNVIQIHEVGEHDGRPYLVLEFAEEGSLARRLDGTPVAPAAAAGLVETLARAIDAAHRHGIVHRDLKPSNVLLVSGQASGGRQPPVGIENGNGEEGKRGGGEWGSEANAEDGGQASGGRKPAGNTGTGGLRPPLADLVPKISDFGLAKRSDGDDALTLSGAILGSPSYMAPEQAAGDSRDVGPAADIYALGAILYELVTGRPPFKAATSLDTLEQVRTLEPAPPRRLQPKLPRDLETICLKCLEKARSRRYRSALALAEDLERFLAGRPILARPVRAWERAVKWSRRRPAAAALVAVCLLSAISLVAGGLVYNARLRSAVATAEFQRERAREGYREAFEAADRMLSEVGFGELSEVPEADPVRRRLLAEAVGFYSRFLDPQLDADPALRRQAAEAQARLARIDNALGDGAAALRGALVTVELREALAGDFPDDLRIRGDLADALHDLALIHAGADRGDESRAAHRRAIGLLEPMAAESGEARRVLAHCYGDLASMLGAREPDEAERLYRRALEIRERFVAENPSDADAVQSLAETFANLGNFAVGFGRPADAAPNYQRAVELLKPVADDSQPGRRPLFTLVECHKALGILLSVERPAQAQEHFDRSLKFAKELVRRHPNVPGYQLSMAQSFHTLGQHYSSTNQPEKSLAAYREAVRLREPLVERDPREFYAAIGLAETLMNLSTVEGPTAGAAAAETTLRRALAVLAPLAEDHGASLPVRRAEGGVWQNLANTLRAQGRIDEALDAHLHSNDVLDAAVRDAPQDATARQLCLNAHGAAAITKGSAGRHAEALADWDRVVELADEPARQRFRFMRVLTAAQAGDHARAVADLNELFPSASFSDDDRYNAACVYSLCSAAALADGRLSDDDRTRLVDDYARRAVKIIGELGQAGYFQDSQHAANLRDDPDLAPLRSRSDFPEFAVGGQTPPDAE